MSKIVFTQQDFTELLRLLADTGHAWCRVGYRAGAASAELLCHCARATRPEDQRVLAVRAYHSPDELAGVLGVESSNVGALAIGYGTEAGQAAGRIRWRGALQSLAHLQVLAPAWPDFGGITSTRLPRELPERLSRTRGALGDDTWLRLVSLRYAVVGVGRIGAQLALELARLGATDIVLVDPDRVEEHNLGEMPLPSASTGRLKVEAVAEMVRETSPDAAVMPLGVSTTSRRGLAALSAADCLFCCVDESAARLAVAGLAAAYLKPCLHIGSGVFAAGEEREAGLDLRLTLGDACPVCMGGLPGLEEARRRLSTGWTGRWVENWHAQRAGSLRSLNLIAVGAALQLWCDFLAGRTGAVWMHLEIDSGGRIRTTYPAVTRAVDCPVCRNRGLGDEMLLRAS